MTLMPIGTEPPNNTEAEQALLGAIFYDNKAFDLVADVLKPEHFYSALHQRIYEVIGDIISSGKKVTPTLAKGYLLEGPWTKENLDVGQYLRALVAEAGAVVSIEDYAAQIRDYAARRDLIDIGRSVVDFAWTMNADGGSSPEAQIDDAERRLFELRKGLAASTERSATLGSLGARLLNRIEHPEEGDAALAFSTGLADLDRQLGGGFRRGRLLITAGRPGMGKTVLAVSTARRVALAGLGVLFISLEIDDEEIAARFMADDLAHSIQPVPYRDILRGAPELGQRERVRIAKANIEALPIIIDTTGALTMAAIEGRVRRAIKRFERQGKELALVVIDYLGLIRPTDRYRGRKVDEIGEVVTGCVELKKRYGVCVHLLAQLSRDVEKRDDKRPVMADLRDSGEIENHADAVLLCYRPAYYLEKTAKFRNGDADVMNEAIDKGRDLELIADKNRLGPPGTVHLFCDVANSRVDNQARFG